jgi:transposase
VSLRTLAQPRLFLPEARASGRQLEISRTLRPERRLAGKDDALDTVRSARAALASETLALPRMAERREALRLLLIARRSAVNVRREALVQLRCVIVTAPESLRHELRTTLTLGKLLDRCSRAASPAASRPRLLEHPPMST